MADSDVDIGPGHVYRDDAPPDAWGGADRCAGRVPSGLQLLAQGRHSSAWPSPGPAGSPGAQAPSGDAGTPLRAADAPYRYYLQGLSSAWSGRADGAGAAMGGRADGAGAAQTAVWPVWTEAAVEGRGWRAEEEEWGQTGLA